MSLKFSTTATIACTFAGCDFKTIGQEHLKRHIQNRHERPEFNCEFCGKLIKTKDGWKAHLKRHELRNKGVDWPKPPSTHKCQLCEYRASSEARVVIHARIHSAEFPFECSVPGCGHRTKWKWNLKHHEDRHDPMKSTRFKCPLCPKRFCTDYQLARHVRTHTQERTRACPDPDCDYKAATLIQVKRHQRRHHFQGVRCSPLEIKKDEMQNQRSKTDVLFGTRCSLREGLRPVKVSRPSQPSSFGYSEKGKFTGDQRSSSLSCEPITVDSFDSKTLDNGRKVERKTKTANKKRIRRINSKINTCSVCGFATFNSLKKHMRTHLDDKPFHCQVPDCTFQTKWPRSLAEHISRLHTPKKYTCPLEGCDFESKNLVLSRKHRRLHKLPLKKTIVCPLCPKKYASKVGLDNHVLSHTGEKAFNCELCDFTGRTCFSVTYHFRRMHAK